MKNRKTYSRCIQNVLPWKEHSKGRMIQMLHHCVEHDITAFDNSDFNGRNYMGKVFGVALSESGLSRDEIQLISKYGAQNSEGEKLVESVDHLLLELETDYLDLLLLDYPHLTFTIRNAVERLMSQGKILEVGGLNLEESQVRDFGLPLTVNQVPSPFSTPNSLAEIPTLVNAVEEIIHFVWCHGKSKLSVGQTKLFDELQARYGLSENQLYLQWILQHPAHLHPILCFSEKEDITGAASYKENLLDAIDWQKIQMTVS